MASVGNGEHPGIVEEPMSKAHVPLNVSASQRGLVSNENSQSHFQDSTLAVPKRLKFLNFGNLGSPSLKFQQIADQKDDFSRTVPSSSSLHLRQRITRLFSRKLDWPALRNVQRVVQKPAEYCTFYLDCMCSCFWCNFVSCDDGDVEPCHP